MEQQEFEKLVQGIKKIGKLVESVQKNVENVQKDVENIKNEIRPKAPRVKIVKSVTLKSIIDAQASLNYHQEKNGEKVYKGKIVLNITEKDPITNKAIVEKGKKKVLSAFLDKATAKLIFSSIRDNTFRQIFGDYGETLYGGSVKDGMVRSRILKIRPNIDKASNKIKHYIFSIDEGEGKLGENGSIQMKNNPDMSVTSYVPYKEALKFAIEIHDYILQEEQSAFLRGEPLYTIMPVFEGDQKEEKEEVTMEISQETETNESKTKQEIVKEIYYIPVEPWKGKTMGDLSNEELVTILKKTKDSTNEKEKEMYKEAYKEAKRRKEEKAV